MEDTGDFLINTKVTSIDDLLGLSTKTKKKKKEKEPVANHQLREDPSISAETKQPKLKNKKHKDTSQHHKKYSDSSQDGEQRKQYEGKQSSQDGAPRKQYEGKKSSLFSFKPTPQHVTAQEDVQQVNQTLFSVAKFSELDLNPYMVSNLEENMGFKTATKIQQLAIPEMLKGGDLCVKSATGSGKTLAYVIPLVTLLCRRMPKVSRSDGVLAVIILPTRELAQQTYDCVHKMIQPFSWIVPGILMGGENRKSEKARIRKGLNIVISTPKRLVDHIEHTACLKLTNTQTLILDEGDRLLEMGYEQDIKCILASLGGNPCLQTVLLSATMTPRVQQLSSLSLNKPQFVDVMETAEHITQDTLVSPQSLQHHYLIVPTKLRLATLAAFIFTKCLASDQPKVMVFLSTQDMVDYHTELISRVIKAAECDISVLKLHGNMQQKDRVNIFKQYKSSTSGVLFTTDVAARGLDLPSVSWTIQYTPPVTAADYVHRAGRTARAGMVGRALSVLAPTEAAFITIMEEHHVKWKELQLDDVLRDFYHCSEQLLGELAKGVSPKERVSLLQAQFEETLLEDRAMMDSARKAYISALRAYRTYPRESRKAFNFDSLHLGHLAKSFALRDKPSQLGTKERFVAGKRREREEMDNTEGQGQHNAKIRKSELLLPTNPRSNFELVSEYASALPTVDPMRGETHKSLAGRARGGEAGRLKQKKQFSSKPVYKTNDRKGLNTKFNKKPFKKMNSKR